MNIAAMHAPERSIYPSAWKGCSRKFALRRFSEVGRLPQHRYGAYDPSPVVSSRTCLASSTNEASTSTSLGPADRKSGASKPRARWISDGMPASFRRLPSGARRFRPGPRPLSPNSPPCTHLTPGYSPKLVDIEFSDVTQLLTLCSGVLTALTGFTRY